MKPIPPGYSEAADNAPIPGRPWWGVQYGNRSRPSIPPQHSVTGFVRSDGAFVAHETWEVRGKVSSVPSADKCGAVATWSSWCGDTESGFHDGPVSWQAIGWVSADAAPLPYADVVGWFAREDVRIVQHDGWDWTGPAPLFWCALPPDPA